MRIWQRFLSSKEATCLCRPFLDVDDKTYATTLKFYSDASLSLKTGGMGAVFRTSWIGGKWSSNFLREEKPSIEFLESFALFAALATWGDHEDLQNVKIEIFCDNESVKNMVNNFTSRCPQCMKLIWLLAMDGIKYNRRVFVQHVRSKQSTPANAISRMDFVRFWEHAPKNMKRTPDAIPEEIWLVQKIWFNNNM